MSVGSIFYMDKMLLFSGGFVPRDIAHSVSQQQYTVIYKEVQAAHQKANNQTCCLQISCLCIGLWLGHCLHEPIANAIFDRAMAK